MKPICLSRGDVGVRGPQPDLICWSSEPPWTTWNLSLAPTPWQRPTHHQATTRIYWEAKKQLYISTEVHARAQPETDEDGADLPLDDTQVGGGGGVVGGGGGGWGGGEKQGRRHKRLELHRVWGIVRMCLWGYNVHIAHSSCRKLMTIQLFNVSYWSACMITI